MEPTKPVATKKAVAKPVTTKKVVTEAVAPKKVVAPKSDKPVLKRRLEQGDSGPTVMWAQNRLRELGYLEKEPNGRYGSLMAKAVRKWQDANGLKFTGVLSLTDWEKL